MSTISSNLVRHLRFSKRTALHARRTRRLAYHLLEGIHGTAEPVSEGVWRWFAPPSTRYGVLVDEADLVLAPAHVTSAADFRLPEEVRP